MKLCTWGLTACMAIPACAQEVPVAPAIDAPRQLPKLLLDDTKAVISSPSDWKTSEWVMVAAGVALIGTSLALDGKVEDAFARNRRPSFDTFARNVETFGVAGGGVLVLGLYLGGHWSDNHELRNTGADAAMAIIVSAGLQQSVKFIAGRSRPEEDAGVHHFQLFGRGDSFPSGHATQAFAIATVISMHSESYWVSAGAYSLATLVGVCRLERGKHYLSDLVTGALLGTTVARIVVRQNTAARSSTKKSVQIAFAPHLGLRYQGIDLAIRF